MKRIAALLITVLFLAAGCGLGDASQAIAESSGSSQTLHEASDTSQASDEASDEDQLPDYLQAYEEFLRGERLASPGHTPWNPICIYEVDTFYDPDRPDTYSLDGSQYALFDMNGDDIPELHVRSGLYYCIFTYYADNLSVWYHGRDWCWPTDNGAILYQRLGAAPTRWVYTYEVLDFWGNTALYISFEKVQFYEGNSFDCGEEEVYFFQDVEVTKEQWDALTEPYLSVTFDNIEWLDLTNDFTHIQ